MLRGAREWLGAKLVKIGMRIVGIDERKFTDRPTWGDYLTGRFEPPNEDDDAEIDTIDTMTSMPVQLGDVARAMVQDGISATSPIKRPVATKKTLLAGSAAARMAQERANQLEALRPKRG